MPGVVGHEYYLLAGAGCSSTKWQLSNGKILQLSGIPPDPLGKEQKLVIRVPRRALGRATYQANDHTEKKERLV